MLSSGQILNNTYKIICPLGSGGGGIIYKAYHIRIKKNVAIKLIKDNAKNQCCNRSEVDILKNLKNDYLPQILDFVEDGDDVYTVMEFIDGNDFKKLIEQGRHFSEKQVINYAIQLCEATEYLHSHNPPIIHSDIKPANIMLTSSNKICLIDFNISSVTQNGIAYSKGGSANFSAPEQFKRIIDVPEKIDEFHEYTRFISDDDETEIISADNSFEKSLQNISIPVSKTKNVGKAFIDMRTDIFGIGVSLYYILTERIPINGKLDFRGIKASPQLCNIIRKATSANPEARYKNVNELKMALCDANKRKPSTKLIVILIMVVVLAISGFVIFTNNDFITNLVKPEEELTDTSYESISEISTTVNTEGTTSKANERQMIILPSFIGNDYSDVIILLRNLGLEYKIEFSTKQYVDVGNNCVYYQSPASGTEVEVGDVITIGISTFDDAHTNVNTNTVQIGSLTSDQLAKELINCINDQRQSSNLSELKSDTVADEIAQTILKDKIDGNYDRGTYMQYAYGKFDHINLCGEEKFEIPQETDAVKAAEFILRYEADAAENFSCIWLLEKYKYVGVSVYDHTDGTWGYVFVLCYNDEK